MLKNKEERRKFIQNEDNWKFLDSYLEGLRVKEMDLGDKAVNVIDYLTKHKNDEVIKDFNNYLLEDVEVEGINYD